MKSEYQEIPLNKIIADDNYRKTFPEGSLAELAQSIKENGVVEPIIVRRSGDGFKIIAGERRFRASEIAKAATIPAIIREVDDFDVLKIQLIENVQREGVPYMEEAYGLQRLRDEHSLDIAELCKIIGKSEAWVYTTLSLTRMHTEAQRLATNGFLTKPVAQLISRIKGQEDQSMAANALARTNKTKLVDIRFARKYIDDNVAKENQPKKRQNAIQKQNGNDFAANWKKYLVNFSTVQFEYFKAIVRGRTDTSVLCEAVEQVMMERGGGVETSPENV